MKRIIMSICSLGLFLSTSALAYTNLTPQEAYDAVINNDDVYILDVRTDGEFIWVGHPNIENVVNISYKIEQKKQWITNPSFVSDVDSIFGAVKNTHIITMCRSGQRSVDAAIVLENAGYTNVSNMLDGFEGGGKDQYGYRTINGWKNSSLPGHTSSVGSTDYYND